MTYFTFHEVTNGGNFYALICVRKYCAFAEEYAETDGILLQDILYVANPGYLGSSSFHLCLCPVLSHSFRIQSETPSDMVLSPSKNSVCRHVEITIFSYDDIVFISPHPSTRENLPRPHVGEERHCMKRCDWHVAAQ